MSFLRRVEDFDCEHCGVFVQGDGYTNHCPKCLWSKHVDVSPGDRAQNCGALMAPIAVSGTTPDYYIIHKCTKCGEERKNKANQKDDIDALISLAGNVL